MSILSPDEMNALIKEYGQRLHDPWWRLTSGALYKIMTKDNPEDEGAVVNFVPNEIQRGLLLSRHFLNVTVKSRQVGSCLDPETPVLTADLRWVPIGDIKPGDEVVAIDEEHRGVRGAARRMRTARVVATKAMVDETYRLTFEDGRSVVCTERHPWLSGKGKSVKWRSLKGGPGGSAKGRLKVGDAVRSVTVPWVDPDAEDGWMGGILDGEGSLANGNRSGAAVIITQRAGPVLDRAMLYAAKRGYSPLLHNDGQPRPSQFSDRPVLKLTFARMDEVFRLIGQTRPVRFIGRRFWEDREAPKAGGWAKIVSIEPLGPGPVVDLQTTTGTYIANGLISHNTTLFILTDLDHALFNANQRCFIIGHDESAAEAIFRDKVKFAYDNLPEPLRVAMPIATKTSEELLFAHNNSSIKVAPSARSGTPNRLLVTEYGKLSAKFPHRAKEVRTGSFSAVPKNGVITVESTAEGMDGEYADLVRTAEKSMALAIGQRRPLHQMEWRRHFVGWWMTRSDEIDPEGIVITAAEHEYFDGVEAEMGVAAGTITLRKRAWYIAKRDNSFGGDVEKMWQEFPSTPGEAFRKSTEGKFFAREVARARAQGRIRDVPFIQHVPVNTFWDIGHRDGTGIWVHQQIHPNNRFLRYFEGWMEPYDFFTKQLDALNVTWGTHFLPHDATHERQDAHRVWTPLSVLQGMKPTWRFEIVPRVEEKQHAISAVRQVFGECLFDQTGCKEGLDHIASYSKTWRTQVAGWSDTPLKDEHTEAADAFMQFAQAYENIGSIGMQRFPKRPGARRRLP